MAGFQFVRIEAYGRSASKKGGGGASMRDVVDEAERRPGSHPHVEKPQRPTLLLGMMPSKVADLAEERAGQAVDAAGRKLRKDANVMVAGVATFPHTVEACKADPKLMAEYRGWEKAAVEFLKKEFGDGLQSVVRHTDEKFPHIHFYVLPDLKNGRLNIADVHCGHAASQEAKSQGKVKGEQNDAYKSAMRRFQDRYSEDVASRFGQCRVGPQRRRLTRAQWRQEQQQMEAIARAKSKAMKLLKKAETKAERVVSAAAQERQTRLADVEQREREVDGRERRVEQFEGLGGRIKAMLKGDTERQVKEAVKAAVEPLESKLEETRGKLDTKVSEVKTLKSELTNVKAAKAEVVGQLGQARARSSQLENALRASAPSHPLVSNGESWADRDNKRRLGYH